MRWLVGMAIAALGIAPAAIAQPPTAGGCGKGLGRRGSEPQLRQRAAQNQGLQPLKPADGSLATASSRLEVGSVALTLGMPEKPVLAALERSYRVERARGAGDDWTVTERSGEMIAVVSFGNGKLDRAAKTWYASSGPEAAALADRLYALASGFAGDGETQCTLGAKPYRIGTAVGNILTLACGSKSIQLNRLRTAGGRVSTTLREVLQ